MAFVLAADHAEKGRLFAAWDSSAQHVEPGARLTPFAARLAPFPTREAAERSLLIEGAVLDCDGAR